MLMQLYVLTFDESDVKEQHEVKLYIIRREQTIIVYLQLKKVL